MGFLLGYVLGARTGRTVALAASRTTGGDVSSEDVLDIDGRVDRLLLIVSAMWALLEESGMTEERLVEKMEEIAAVEEAQNAARHVCRKCGATVPPDLAACQFCGAPTGLEPEIGPLDDV